MVRTGGGLTCPAVDVGTRRDGREGLTCPGRLDVPRGPSGDTGQNGHVDHLSFFSVGLGLPRTCMGRVRGLPLLETS